MNNRGYLNVWIRMCSSLVLLTLIFVAFSISQASIVPSLKRGRPSFQAAEQRENVAGLNKRARRTQVGFRQVVDDLEDQDTIFIKEKPVLMTRAKAKLGTGSATLETTPTQTATLAVRSPVPPGEHFEPGYASFTPSQRRMMHEDVYYTSLQPDNDYNWHCPIQRNIQLMRILCSRLNTPRTPDWMPWKELEALMDASEEENFDWKEFMAPQISFRPI